MKNIFIIAVLCFSGSVFSKDQNSKDQNSKEQETKETKEIITTQMDCDALYLSVRNDAMAAGFRLHQAQAIGRAAQLECRSIYNVQ